MIQNLRLYSPDDSGRGLTAHIPLEDFFESWYCSERAADKRRRPVSPATIARRKAALGWWTRLMATKLRPMGPHLSEITEEHLTMFASALATATYRRGPFGRPIALSQVSQIRTMQEVQLVIAAAGPTNGRSLRAGLIERPPAIWTEPIDAWPKPTWTLEEARKIYAAAAVSTLPARCKISVDAWRRLARSVLSIWFYTGHRASTYQHLQWPDLVEEQPGRWRLNVVAVKSRKRERIAIHYRLLDDLKKLQGLDPLCIVPLPVSYSCLCSQHTAWQQAAGVRIHSPQAWRRLHSDQIAASGFDMARSLAQQSLQHSSASITTSFYTAAIDTARLSLPDLAES